MKVITPIMDVWVGQVECKRCGAELEVEGKDLRITYGDADYQGPEWYEAHVTCPLCDCSITVEAPNQTLRALYWQGKQKAINTNTYEA